MEPSENVTQEGPRWQHELQSDTEFEFQARCRLGSAHSPWSAWSPPFLYSTPEAGGLSRGGRLSAPARLLGVPVLQSFQSRVQVALGDTGPGWPWRCWGKVGLAGLRGIFQPNTFRVFSGSLAPLAGKIASAEVWRQIPVTFSQLPSPMTPG